MKKAFAIFIACCIFPASSIFAADSDRVFPAPVLKFRIISPDPLNLYLFGGSFNPAFTGILSNHLYAFSDVRYPGQSLNPLLLSAGYDHPLKNPQHTIGYRAAYERSGPRFSLRQLISYSYVHSFAGNNVRLRVGAVLGYEYTEYDVNGFSFGDMIDDRYGFIYQSSEVIAGRPYQPALALNGGFSIYLYRLTLNFNMNNVFSFYNPLDPSQTAYFSAFSLYHGSAFYNLRITRKWSINPSVEFFIADRNAYFVEGGIYAYSNGRHGVIAGAAFSTGMTVSARAGYIFNNRFSLLGKAFFPVTSLNTFYPVSGFSLQLNMSFLPRPIPVKHSI